MQIMAPIVQTHFLPVASGHGLCRGQSQEEHDLEGTVKYLSLEKGYGFIECQDQRLKWLTELDSSEFVGFLMLVGPYNWFIHDIFCLIFMLSQPSFSRLLLLELDSKVST